MDSEDIAFTFPSDGKITCKICKMEFNVLIWSDSLRADFCNPCFERYYDKLIEYQKRNKKD